MTIFNINKIKVSLQSSATLP